MSKNNIYIFDGAMGTYYAKCYSDDSLKCEWANINHPERIKKIHNEYIKAGADYIKTNTFAAFPKALECNIDKIKDIINAAWSNASEAVKNTDCKIFADMCPIDEDEEDIFFVINEFISLGAKNFLFETLSNDENIEKFTTYIKQKCKDAYIIVSYACTPDGFTRQGKSINNIIENMCKLKTVDALGLNCISGPLHIIELSKKIFEKIKKSNKHFCVMPNAGYPTVINGRTVFESSPNYFAEKSTELLKIGVHIIGGCCGTTPEHISEMKKTVFKNIEIKKNIKIYENEKNDICFTYKNNLYEKLKAGKRVIAVELDPPPNADIEKFMAGAKRLKQIGIDAVTIADCPVARARVDSSLLAAKLHRELKIDTIPHMTCRDRNINATKALLLGLCVEGVNNVLVVTGDPVPSAEKNEVKAVFSFNSVVLANYIKQLSNDGLCAPFCVYGALNVNARNFDMELKKAIRKQEAGVSVFLTQPLFSERSFENLKKANKVLKSKILGGIIPIVSYKNALFMSQEMAGIDIPKDIVEMYKGLERNEAEQLAVDISVNIIRNITDLTQGLYLITPFQRVNIIEKILNKL